MEDNVVEMFQLPEQARPEPTQDEIAMPQAEVAPEVDVASAAPSETATEAQVYSLEDYRQGILYLGKSIVEQREQRVRNAA